MHFESVAQDIADVVAIELKRFNANDQSDIDAMIVRSVVRGSDCTATGRARRRHGDGVETGLP